MIFQLRMELVIMRLNNNIKRHLPEKSKEMEGLFPDDNVCIYVPLDLNADQILSRLQQIYRVMGSPNDMNEMEFSCEVGKIISQLEIYDQVWVARDLKNEILASC